MYRQKMSHSLLKCQTNLNKIIQDRDKRLTIPLSFIFRDKHTIYDAYRNLRDIKTRLKVYYENLFFSRILQKKEVNMLRLWTHQCECVLAHRLRRGQQMFCLYSRLWEEHAFRDLLNQVKRRFVQGGSKLLLGAVAFCSYDWENKRIPIDEIYVYANEISSVHSLVQRTLVCPKCLLRRLVDKAQPGVEYCKCPNSEIEKNTDPWQPFIERDTICVWKKENENGQVMYKFYGSYDDVTPNDFFQCQINTEYRKIWDDSAIELNVIESEPKTNSDIIYWNMKWPRFFNNRDYLFKRRYIVDKEMNVMIVVSQSTTDYPCCEKTDSIRVSQYWSYIVIKPHTTMDQPGLEFCITYFDNPGINVPPSVSNWVTASGMPDFLDKQHKAARGYRAYKEELDAKRKSERKKRRKNKKGGHKVVVNRDESDVDQEVLTASCTTENADKNNKKYWSYLHPFHYFY